MALDPEIEFKKGLQALQRGRTDIAAIRFTRAEKGGVDVRSRIGERPPKQKIVSGKGLQELTVEQFKEIQSMKPIQSGMGKEWNPDQSAAMRRNAERGLGSHHQQNSQKNVVELPKNQPSVIPGTTTGTGSAVNGVKNVTWNSTSGALIITYDDDTTSSIPFFVCP